MYCSKCGSQTINGERFCKNCGYLLENNQQQFINNINNGQNQQPMVNGTNGQSGYNYQQSINQQSVNPNLNSNYINQAVNPNMKKWAILSIVVPIVGIIWYWFIGLNLYLAIFISAAGFGFAEKGKMASKKLSNIGKVCNGILVGLAIIMFVLNLILAINN